MMVFKVAIASVVVVLLCVVLEASANSAARADANSDSDGQVSTVLVEDNFLPDVETLRAILREVTNLPHWVRRIIIFIIRLLGDPHLTFGNPAEPDYFVCYNMGGEDGVTYDFYTHAHEDFVIAGRIASAEHFTYIDQVQLFLDDQTFTFNLEHLIDSSSHNIRWGSVYEFALPRGGHVKGFAGHNHFEILVDGYRFETQKSDEGTLSVVLREGDITQLDGLVGRIHSYSIEGNSTEIDAYAALKLNGEPRPILVQKVQHPHGECWKHIQIEETNEITGDVSLYEH